jgi:hypothetical protein
MRGVEFRALVLVEDGSDGDGDDAGDGDGSAGSAGEPAASDASVAEYDDPTGMALVEVGSATAVDPDRLYHEIESRRDAGEIDLPEDAEVWVIPARSFMERMAVPNEPTSSVEDGLEVHYADDEDRRYGEEYVALRPSGEREYVVEGRVRAVKPEVAARTAAAFRGGRRDAKPVVLVPQKTIERRTVAASG